MLNKRAQAERAREAAKKAEAAAEKYDKLSGKILDFMVEKCSKCGFCRWCCKPCKYPWPYQGGPLNRAITQGQKRWTIRSTWLGFTRKVTFAWVPFSCHVYNTAVTSGILTNEMIWGFYAACVTHVAASYHVHQCYY